MAESNLAVAYKELRADVGFFLGFGRGEDYGDTAYSNDQLQDLTFILRSGLRQFYNPPPMNGVVYRWSFLRPVTTLILSQGVNTVMLPDDFGGIEDRITVTGTSTTYWPVTITGEGRIRELYSRFPNAAGQPELAAQQPIKNSPSQREGQRVNLFVYPTPDQDYTLSLAYYIQPDFLSGTRPYAYGGVQHAETLLESCLAIAEQKLDDAMGVHTQKFMERLAASIAIDQAYKPANLGYNADRSDNMDEWNWRNRYLSSQVTQNGIQY